MNTVHTKVGRTVFFPAYAIVQQLDTTGQGDFEIVGVELYCDSEYKICLADLMPFEAFDLAAQSAIHDALDIQDGRLKVVDAMATVARLTAENERLQRENSRHRRNGLLRLAADLKSPETLEDIALLRMENAAVERIMESQS